MGAVVLDLLPCSDRCSPFFIPMLIGNMAAGLTAIQTGAQGLTHSHSLREV